MEQGEDGGACAQLKLASTSLARKDEVRYAHGVFDEVAPGGSGNSRTVKASSSVSE